MKHSDGRDGGRADHQQEAEALLRGLQADVLSDHQLHQEEGGEPRGRAAAGRGRVCRRGHAHPPGRKSRSKLEMPSLGIFFKDNQLNFLSPIGVI